MKNFILILAAVALICGTALNKPLIGASTTNSKAISSLSDITPGAPQARVDFIAAAAAGIVGFAWGLQLGWNAWGFLASHPDSLNSPNGKQPISMRSLDN